METHLYHHGFFLLRTPLLPYQVGADLSAERIRTLYQNPVLQEAILVASPEFYEEMMRWLNGEPVESAKDEKIKITLAKYLLRMSSRCTPFGLFAGVSLGHWDTHTSLRLPALAGLERHSRFDMDGLCAWASKIAQTPAIRDELTYYPNNTLYQAGNEWRYVEYRVETNVRDHFLVNIPATEYLERILSVATNGATYTLLVACLVEEDIHQEEATDFIHELIAGRVLVSELEPAVTGEPYLSRLQKSLSQYESSKPLAHRLQTLEKALRQVDCLPVGTGIPLYEKIKQQVQEFELPFAPGNVFQVDMHKPTPDNTLGTGVMTELKKVVHLLAQLPSSGESSRLKEFKQAFYARYEAREVAFVDALDTEMGIGYPVSGPGAYDFDALLDSVPLETNETDHPSYEWSPWQQFLLEKYAGAIGQHLLSIELREEELSPFLQEQVHQLPASLYSFVSLLASSSEAVDRGEFQLIHQSTSGPSAANLLGRFCHLNASLTEALQTALRKEEATQADAIFAEIVHINQARIGNIVVRPVLRAYEIPILVQAGVDEAHTIRLADLTLSMQNNQLILRSKRLNKRVIPRLSTAHNYALRALPHYRFLCDLQFQDNRVPLKWDWGALQHAPFLPRVCYSKTILAKARWLLKEEVARIVGLSEPDLVAAVSQIRQQRCLPRHVTMVEGDHRIPLDLDNVWCLKILQSIVKPARPVVLEECLHQESKLVVEAKGERFVNELIVPLGYQPPPVVAKKNIRPPVHRSHPHTSVTQRFSPGSEWLYVKLYCGIKTADKLLLEVIQPLAAQWFATQVIDQWFFIRYTDQVDGHARSHVRIRFHQAGGHHYAGDSSHTDTSRAALFYGQSIHALNRSLQPYVEAGWVSNLTTDTYLRELERYGYANILATESLFFYDTIAVIQLLPHLQEDEKASLRLPLALKGIDAFLDDFQLALEAKKHLLEQLQSNFKREFRATHALTRKALGNQYRQQRPLIERALQPGTLQPDDSEDAFTLANQIFKERSIHLQPIAAEIRQYCQSDASSVALEDLLASYVHMFVNRLFPSRQRMHELVVYDFLFQYYTSLQAQRKRAFLPPTPPNE